MDFKKIVLGKGVRKDRWAYLMKQKQIIRYVEFTNLKEFDGYAITDQNGELDTFYPVNIHQADWAGYCDTYEISSEFFTRIAILQDQGVKVIFKR